MWGTVVKMHVAYTRTAVDFPVVRSKRLCQQAYSPACCSSGAAQNLGTWEVSQPPAWTLLGSRISACVGRWVWVGREVCCYLWLEQHLLPGVGNGEGGFAWSWHAHSGASCGLTDISKTCLESSEKHLLWMRELRFLLEVSLVSMFWEEQVAYPYPGDVGCWLAMLLPEHEVAKLVQVEITIF